jgi:hypothetical protein
MIGTAALHGGLKLAGYPGVDHLALQGGKYVLAGAKAAANSGAGKAAMCFASQGAGLASEYGRQAFNAVNTAKNSAVSLFSSPVVSKVVTHAPQSFSSASTSKGLKMINQAGRSALSDMPAPSSDLSKLSTSAGVIVSSAWNRFRPFDKATDQVIVDTVKSRVATVGKMVVKKANHFTSSTKDTVVSGVCQAGSDIQRAHQQNTDLLYQYGNGIAKGSKTLGNAAWKTLGNNALRLLKWPVTPNETTVLIEAAKRLQKPGSLEHLNSWKNYLMAKTPTEKAIQETMLKMLKEGKVPHLSNQFSS